MADAFTDAPSPAHATLIVDRDGHVTNVVRAGNPIWLAPGLTFPRPLRTCLADSVAEAIEELVAAPSADRARSISWHGSDVLLRATRVDGVTVVLVDSGPKVAPPWTDAEALLRAVSLSALVLDPELRIRWATDAMHARAGRTKLAGLPLEALRATLPVDTIRQAALRVSSDGGALTCEVDGVTPLRVRAMRLEHEDRAPSVIITLEDVSELRRLERSLREEHLLLEAFLESSPVPLYVKDLESRYLYASKFVRDMLGMEAEALGRARDIDYMPASLANALVDHDRQVIEDGTVHEFEETIAVFGQRRLFLSLKFPLFGRDGTVRGVGAVSTDITNRARAEGAVRGELRERDDFLAMLSHELRNPLAAIAHAGDVLAEGAGEEEARQAVDVIVRHTAHARRMLADLLDVSRVRMGTLDVDPRPMPLAASIEESVASVASAAEKRGVRVVSGPTDIWVKGDRTRLTQALSNLLLNAVRFTPSGEAVEVLVRTVGDDAIVEVKDRGPGVDPHVEPRLFELFFHHELRHGPSDGGLGLGLGVVRAVALAHGGEVIARHNADRGMTFAMRLPTVAPRRTPVDLTFAAVRPLRILLVEDQDDSRAMLSWLLVKRGHEVLEAPDGQQGLARLLEAPPDLAIIDIGLPHLDGYGVVRRFRAERPDARTLLVAMTGYGRAGDRQRAREAGFDEHLVKPVSRAELEALLTSAGSTG